MRVLIACAGTLLLTSLAHAEDPSDDLCYAESLEGQILQKHGHVARAIEHLERCAQPDCEEAMRARCAEWLSAAKVAVPIVEVRVVDDLGKPLPGAMVRLDGQLVDVARPLRMDLGSHELRAEYLGRRTVLAFDPQAALQVTKLVIDLRSTMMVRPAPLGTWASLATSLVGFVAFGAFGTWTLVQAGQLSSSCAPFCDPSSRPPFDAAEIGADVSLGVGLVAAALAGVLYLARPSVVRPIRIGAGVMSIVF